MQSLSKNKVSYRSLRYIFVSELLLFINYTLGINWYLNQSIRFLLDYNLDYVDNYKWEEKVRSLQLRSQFCF